MSVKFEDDKMLLKNKNTSINMTSDEIEFKNGSSVSIKLTKTKITFKTPKGEYNWDMHKHKGNLGAPTDEPIPGS